MRSALIILTVLIFSVTGETPVKPWLKWTGMVVGSHCGSVSLRQGSAFLLQGADPKGNDPLFVSAFHVIKGCTKIRVEFPRQKQEPLELKAYLVNLNSDIVLLKPVGASLEGGFRLPGKPGADATRSGNLRMYGFKGTSVAIDIPAPLSPHSTALGFLHFPASTSPSQDAVVYQVDYGPAPGTSGAPIVNSMYEVVGVLIGGHKNGGVGINFAIAIEHLWKAPKQFKTETSWHPPESKEVVAEVGRGSTSNLQFDGQADPRVVKVFVPEVNEAVEFIEIPTKLDSGAPSTELQTLLMRTEASQRLYNKLRGRPNTSAERGELPAVVDNPRDAMEACGMLRNGQLDERYVSRLPYFEEFAAAAGELGSEGELPCKYNLFSALPPSACNSSVRARFAQPVGTLRPNEHGFYDLYGNVWEWVIGPKGTMLVGGGFDTTPRALKQAAENGSTLLAKQRHYRGLAGFRCVYVQPRATFKEERPE